MENKIKMRFILSLISFVFVFSAFFVFVGALQVTNGQTVDPAGCSNCKVVTTGSTLWVGTNTCGEWNSFLAALPGGTSVSNCCTTHASTGCPSAPNGNRYWYNSCGAQEDLLEICSGDICIDPGNNRHRTGCSGGACTYTDQNCGYPGYYCGQGADDDVWWNPGCVDPNGCASNYMAQDCFTGQYFCDSNSPHDRWLYTGCLADGQNQCTWSWQQDCNYGDYNCQGSDRYQYGCASGACNNNYVEPCTYGCSGAGVCNGAPAGCYDGDGYYYSHDWWGWMYEDVNYWGGGGCSYYVYAHCTDGSWGSPYNLYSGCWY